MQHLLRQFTKTMGHEADLYRALLAELVRERHALAASDLAGIQAVVATKKELLNEIDGTEKKRLSLQRRLAAMLDCPVDELSFGRLLDGVGGALQGQLQTIRCAMEEVVPRVRHLQQHNRLLVKHGLKLVSNSLDFFSRGPSACCVYRASGRLHYGTHGGRLLRNSI